jgi:hypothetical protein
MSIYRDENLGPVVAIIRAKDEADAMGIDRFMETRWITIETSHCMSRCEPDRQSVRA